MLHLIVLGMIIFRSGQKHFYQNDVSSLRLIGAGRMLESVSRVSFINYKKIYTNRQRDSIFKLVTAIGALQALTTPYEYTSVFNECLDKSTYGAE